MANEGKARGLYDKLPDILKEYYDTLMAVKFHTELAEFSIKELAYLSKLYEEKVVEIKSAERELTPSDIEVLVKANKIRYVVSKRKINVMRMTRGSYQLSVEKKTAARTKLNRLFSGR